MNKHIIIILLCFLPFVLNAQTAFSELAKSYAESGNFEEAIRLESQSIDLLKQNPADYESYAIALANLAFYNDQVGNIDVALQLELEAINVLKQQPDHDQGLMILLMIDLASYYANIGNYQQSIIVGNECRELIISNLGTDDSTYLTCLNNLAVSYSQLGEHENAFQISTEIIDLLNVNESKDTTYKISPLLIISNYYLEIGNYANALKNAKFALKISRSLGCHNYEESRCLNLIAGIYDAIGDYKECIINAEESTNIRKLLDGENSIAYARSLNNLSQFYAHAGNYKEAIKYGEAAKIIRLQFLGEDHPEYLNSLHSLACISSDLGNYKEAKALEEIVANKRKKLWGEEHPSYLNALMGISTSYAGLGQYKEAINIGIQVDSILYSDSLQYGMLYYANLKNLSWFYGCDGQLNEALVYANKLVEVCRNKFGDSSLEYLKALHALSYIHYKQNNFKGAIRILENELSCIMQFFGEEHPLYIDCIADLTVLYSYSNDENKLRVYAPHVFDTIRDQYTSYFSFLTSSERKNVWEKRRSLFYKTFPLIAYKYSHDNEEYMQLAYDTALFSKGILLNSEIEFDRFLTHIGSDALAEKYTQLKLFRQQLTKSLEKPLSERTFESDSLKKEINTLERQLLQKASEFGAYTNALVVNWKDVRDNLKDNEVAIEFVSFPFNNDSIMYIAYVVKHDSTVPEMVELFEENDLTSMIDQDDKTNIYNDKSATELIWGKLKSQLENIKNIYFAPDGVLHQIAIEYFSDIDGNDIISDRYNIYRLSSTREIAVNRQQEFVKDAIIYGGIKYDSDLATMEEQSRKFNHSKTRGMFHYNLGDSITLRGSLEYLDGSLIEAENVNDMMKENHYRSIFISGYDATEESFKNLSGKVNGILHISTHGFYWSIEKAERKAQLNERLYFMSQLGDHARKNEEEKALTRTGLYMAGAKNALAGIMLNENIEDGLLTAQEIASLDLRGLGMVVLSACQTGMGDISGDGVFGLQRGFKKAGAGTILMSLWDVSDEATQILMTEFYKNYLNGKSKRESLLASQKVVRETPGFEDPEYWAAFILLDALN